MWVAQGFKSGPGIMVVRSTHFVHKPEVLASGEPHSGAQAWEGMVHANAMCWYTARAIGDNQCHQPMCWLFG
jgi:hypothetical protein